MSNVARVAGQAANTLVKPLNVEDVFSTYLYTGTSTSPNTITNGIDLDGEGGMVWLKTRTASFSHTIFDTERGVNKEISSDVTTGEGTGTSVTAFNSDGFTLGTTSILYNSSSYNYASWTFRKAPKFFDVVTYTGDGVAGREIAHNLGCEVGMIVVKCLNNVTNWAVYHRGVDSTAPEDYVLRFNDTTARVDTSVNWNDTAPTSTNFTVGTNSWVNRSGDTYVAYLFAHNDGDGGFNGGDIIKCGSYTGNGSTDGPEIDLGFEPQWIMIKNATASQSWWMFDTMRGIVTSSNGADDARLKANATTAEDTQNRLHVTSTGFKLTSSASGVNDSNTFIYIAIRRDTKVPESGTEVFSVSTRNASEPAYTSGFPVDFAFARAKNIANNWDTGSRLQQGNRMFTNLTNAEASNSNMMFDYQDGWSAGTGASTEYLSWMWRRAPNFFDVVAYTGTGSNQTISHNLGVSPKFMFVKERTTANNWVCYLEALGNDKRMGLNAASSVATDTTAWQSTTPTDSAFYVGANTQTNVSGEAFIAYLFGEVAGISKFGTYTGTGAAQNIDCGFSSGARFVLIKTYAGTNPNANWNVWDSERGIIAGNDPYLALNSTSAEVTSTDVIDPYSSGFALTSSGVANNSGTSYWFYAIA